MIIPKRIQRRRVKGYRQPPKTRYCGRGTMYANGYKIGEPDWETGKPMTREDVLKRFRGLLQSLISLNGWEWFVDYYLRPLMEYDHLSCFCPLDKSCHVDIWIEYLEKVK
jgi:Domain of unknown function (DUF4326)